MMEADDINTQQLFRIHRMWFVLFAVCSKIVNDFLRFTMVFTMIAIAIWQHVCVCVYGASNDKSGDIVPSSMFLFRCAKMQKLSKCMHQHEICLLCTFLRFSERFSIHLMRNKSGKNNGDNNNIDATALECQRTGSSYANQAHS